MAGLGAQDNGKVDLDFYGATDCINDDDDDYGVSVDMAGILGNPGQDVANAVADLVDSDDEPALDGLYGPADSTANFMGSSAPVLSVLIVVVVAANVVVVERVVEAWVLIDQAVMGGAMVPRHCYLKG